MGLQRSIKRAAQKRDGTFHGALARNTAEFVVSSLITAMGTRRTPAKREVIAAGEHWFRKVFPGLPRVVVPHGMDRKVYRAMQRLDPVQRGRVAKKMLQGAA